MTSDDDLVPQLGRSHAKQRAPRSYLGRVLAATNLARGSAAGRGRGFSGSRIARGAGVGRLLASRDRHAAYRRRRVVIKARIVRLAGKGLGAARAHLRYIQRDGVTCGGEPGELYDAETDRADGKAFLSRQARDRHQFRFIVAAEDGGSYDELKTLTRRLMARMEADLGTRLDWVAVDHFNTGHPHTHIVVRGKDERGQDLVIARDYLTQGLRERACELVDLDLGPRSSNAIEAGLRAEVDAERLTSLDRALLRAADAEGVVRPVGRDAFEQSLRIGRLRRLVQFGLARPDGPGRWRLETDLAGTLRRMGQRGDIIRLMQRAYAARGDAPALVDQVLYEPAAGDARPIVGRVLERGLSDEFGDRHYLIVEATDGRSHFVEVGRGAKAAPTNEGAIVRIEPVPAAAREVDRTVAAVAAANGGRYSVEAHRSHDAGATRAFAEAHVRRLEAMRRLTGAVAREADGHWLIAPDHLERAAAYEAARARDRPVEVTTLSAQPLEVLAAAEAATWLDRELLADAPEPLRDAGFGREVREAQAQRRQWLVGQGLAEDFGGVTAYRADLLAVLCRRELLRVAAQLGRELGLPFGETLSGERVEGCYRRPLELLSGRFALIERSHDFTLVPWRPVLERQIGKRVSGLLRGDRVSWTIGRGRSGPALG